ncbi:MAG: RNA polymerase sigma-54 factor [Bacteroidetes bacterium]|jgi:RNA polymerase sigma-54 factor|nr:MAG: RNA polymerase sigma-54 factor [Bacteroidota bacterium]
MAQRLEGRQSQKQKLEGQQKLSPQQIQFIKLIQLPLAGLERRVKQELENNPVLEESDASDVLDAPDIADTLDASGNDTEISGDTEVAADGDFMGDSDSEGDSDSKGDANSESDADIESTLDNEEFDWETYAENTEYEGTTGYSVAQLEEWNEIPDPYRQTLLEKLEDQVNLLDLTDPEKIIADQILGSLDENGYFRRENVAVADNIAFNYNYDVSADDVERIRRKIQRLEPAGIASRDLRDCLLSQISSDDSASRTEQLARDLLMHHWNAFEKKHFQTIQKRMGIDEQELGELFDWIRTLNPKPGSIGYTEESEVQYIEPEFEVIWNPDASGDEDEFTILMSHKNLPDLRISPQYKKMWDALNQPSNQPSAGKQTASQSAKGRGEEDQARAFIKEKMESAMWFIESIRQRQNTLRKTMSAIVQLQQDFFRYGEPIRPMILKDVAEIIQMDISTVSRVVNGKYVQTRFGVYELKYLFSESLETEDGEDVSTREVKKILQQMMDDEDKSSPLSDQKLADGLAEQGYKVARRTVTKYREQMHYPVARLRKQIG